MFWVFDSAEVSSSDSDVEYKHGENPIIDLQSVETPSFGKNVASIRRCFCIALCKSQPHFGAGLAQNREAVTNRRRTIARRRAEGKSSKAALEKEPTPGPHHARSCYPPGLRPLGSRRRIPNCVAIGNPVVRTDRAAKRTTNLN
jgi:hypothetical protein